MTISPLANSNSNTLTHHCKLKLKRISVDAVRLKQALFNLLSNACKFTQQSTIRRDVCQRTDKQGDWICFKVSDAGIGITEKQMQQLFSEFTQADSTTTRKYGGTGLGLAISRRLCQLMDGDIEAESIYGEGSTFTVKHPPNLLEHGTVAGNHHTTD